MKIDFKFNDMKEMNENNLSQIISDDVKKMLTDLLDAKTIEEIDDLHISILEKIKYMQSISSIDKRYLLELDFTNIKESNLSLIVKILKSKLLSIPCMYNDSDIDLHMASMLYVLDLEL